MTASRTDMLIVGVWLIPIGWLWCRRPSLRFPALDSVANRRTKGSLPSGSAHRGADGWGRGFPATVLTSGAGHARLTKRWQMGAAAVGLAGLGAALSWLLPAAVVLWVGARRSRSAAQRNRARAAAADQAANLASLVELTLYGGVSLRRALQDVQPWMGPPLGPVLGRLMTHVDHGGSLLEELAVLVNGVHPELEALWRLVRAVEQDGAPAAPALSALAAEGRLERRHRLEQSARRLPVRLLLPLIGGVLPAFVLLAVVPMLAGALVGLRAP